MRPIKKPPLPDHAFGTSASALLLQTLGEYCSVCEEPIPDVHHVWHKRLGVEVRGAIEPGEWVNVLLLSHNAFLSQLGKLPNGLLFPDDHITYIGMQASPFRYEKKLATEHFTADDNVTILETRKTEFVIVVGRTQQATDTIEFFKLNSAFYDASTSTVKIARSVYHACFDRRLQQRTAAWDEAESVATALLSISGNAPEDEETREAIVRQGRRVAAATGFWSTWAAALAMRGVDSKRIRSMLLPPALPWERGPGPHNPFPGTNQRALP
jgi:hypothetical protein